MKLLSKIIPASSTLQSWIAPELDVDRAPSATSVQNEQLLALFGATHNNTSRGQESGPRSNLHTVGTKMSLTNWFPNDIGLQPDAVSRERWDFVETSIDSFKAADPQSVKNRPDAEKEKAKLLQDARTQADQIILEARAAAEQIIQQAQTECEQVKRDGYQQGWNTAHSELQAALAATHEIVQETRQWQSSLLQEGEQILVGMLKELAQTMFGEGVRLDADALQINLNRIMENAQRLGDLNIFLNPQDANLLDASWRDYQLLITGNKVRIIPSEQIRPGGCIVKGNMGMVDGRVETQLAAVLNSIDEMSEVGK